VVGSGGSEYYEYETEMKMDFIVDEENDVVTVDPE